MPKLPIRVDDFSLVSSYSCGVTEIISGDGSRSYNYYKSEPAKPGSCTKNFSYTLPNGSEIKTMTIYAELGKPSWGSTQSTINGIEVGINKMVSVAINDVSSFGLTGTVTIPFKYTCYDNVHQHSTSDGTEVSRVNQGTATHVGYRITHPSTLTYKNVYLEIEYTCGVYFHHGENGLLVPYQLYHAENNELVPYQLFNTVDNELIQY